MLMLSRKVGEKIVLPDQNVVVTVCQISRTNVRIGITAPSSVPIYRQEIYERLEGASGETDQRLGMSSKRPEVEPGAVSVPELS